MQMSGVDMVSVASHIEDHNRTAIDAIRPSLHPTTLLSELHLTRAAQHCAAETTNPQRGTGSE